MLSMSCFEKWSLLISGGLFFATFLLFGVTLALVLVARKQLLTLNEQLLSLNRQVESDHSMRKKAIINKLYERFLEDDLYELYEKIKTDQPFELSPTNKRALNKAFTLFDEIEYFKAEKLFDEKLWEYIGCEIVNLSCHKDVQRFLRETEKQYPEPKNQSQKDMMPFTGFKELVKKLPDPYWFKKKPNLEEDVEG